MATKKPKAQDLTPIFPKESILTFRKYANRRDLLSALLDDGKEYTMDQVDRLIDNFMKER